MREYIQLLRKRPSFRSLWLAAVVSLAGDWFNTIASVIIVNRYTDSGLALSWILIAKTLPRFFLGPLAGVVADRFSRKAVMIVSDLLRAGVVLCFLFVDRAERIWLIYLLTTVQIVISSFFEPASSAILPSLVEGNQELVTANVIRNVTWSLMLAVGSALGGGFAALFGAEGALVVDALTYLVSAVLVTRIVVPSAFEPEITHTSGWTDFVDGFRYVVKRADVAILTLVKAMGQIGSGDIVIAVYAERLFRLGREGAGALGIMFAAAGIGAVIGPLIGNRLTDGTTRTLRWAILAGYLFIPLGWLVMGLAPSLWVASLGILLRLMGSSVNWTYSSVLIQFRVPNKFLGRVFALDMAMFTVFSSTFIYLTGYLLDTYGLDPRQVVGLFALGGLVPPLLWSFRLWRVTRRESAAN